MFPQQDVFLRGSADNCFDFVIFKLANLLYEIHHVTNTPTTLYFMKTTES